MGNVLQLGLKGADLTEPSHRGILRNFARGRQQLPNEPIVGLINRQTVTDPGVEDDGAAGMLRLAALVAKQSRPLAGKVIGVIRRGEQSVNHPISISRGRVGFESPNLIGCGQSTGNIESDPAQEGGLVGNFTGGHTHLFELLEDQLVDEVFGQRQSIHGGPKRNRGAESGHLTLITDHHSKLTRLIEDLEQTIGIGRGHVLVVGLKERASGDVLGGTIRVVGRHDQLLLTIQCQRPRRGENFEPLDSGRVGLARRHALGDPAHQPAVVI